MEERLKVIAIDPGDVMSAYVVLNQDYDILDFGKLKNEELVKLLQENTYSHLAIEMIASYGMAVGKTVFETCVWIGRFWENVKADCKEFVYRKEEKTNLCGSMKAKDSNIRQALIDRFAKFDFKNGKGTKKEPDTFYGFKADIWAAMAVGVTYLDRLKENE